MSARAVVILPPSKRSMSATELWRAYCRTMRNDELMRGYIKTLTMPKIRYDTFARVTVTETEEQK